MKFDDELKNAISKDFDKICNMKLIKERIGEDRKMRNKKVLFKYASMVACIMLLLVVSLIAFGNNDKPQKIVDNGSDKIFVNNANNTAIVDLDVKIATTDVNEDFFNLYPFTKSLATPQRLNNSYIKVFYIRKDNKQKEYDILNNYEVVYENLEDSGNNIKIKFSKDYQPLRDYYIESKNAKESVINGTKITIYNYHQTYMTTFRYNNINFDIETRNITESEFVALLYSIIK